MEPAIVALVVGAVVAGVGAIAIRTAGRKVRLNGRVYPSVADFVERFGAELGLPGEVVREPSLIANPACARFRGTLPDGRRAQVSFPAPGEVEGLQYLEGELARVAVSCETVPQLSVTLKGLLARLGAAVGLMPVLESGDRAFDERFLLQTLEPSRAKRSLEKVALREAIESVFAHFKLRSLELLRGEVVALVRVRDVPVEHYATLLQRLVALAKTIDELAVKVHAGESAHARCGYCHDELAPDAADSLACEVCQTITHKACRAELGRCPVAGCAGTKPEHARTRSGA